MTNALVGNGLFGSLFSDAKTAAAFSAPGFLGHMIAFETAWTRALMATDIVSAADGTVALQARPFALQFGIERAAVEQAGERIVQCQFAQPPHVAQRLLLRSRILTQVRPIPAELPRAATVSRCRP